MGGTEKGNIDLLGRLQTPPFGASSSSTLANHQLVPNNNKNNHLDVSQLNLSHIQNLHNSPIFGSENITRVAGFPPSHPQMPPTSPYSQLPFNRPSTHQMGLQTGPCHSRSLSQPSIFTSDSLPPLPPSPYKDTITSPRSGLVRLSPDHSENHELPPCVVGGGREGLPPRKHHRRSMSDVPFGYTNGLFQSPPPPPDGGGGVALQRTLSGGDCAARVKPAQLVKKETCWEETKPDGNAMEDLLAAYMNLDCIDALNSRGPNSRNGNENLDDMDSEASNSKTKGGDNSDNDVESSVSESGCNGKCGIYPVERKEGLKRSAVGDITSTIRHQRSISMDSFMGKLQLCDDPPNLQPSAAETSKVLGLEFRSGEFTGVEMKKIMVNEKLVEIAMADPKRAKRILANRQSAARSKERKMRYISELEHKVQTLQSEATTLSAQFTMLQKDSEGLTTLNNELKFRLQSMEQQAQLRDALNDALTKEIQRLRIATGELAEPRAWGTKPFGFNCQMLQQAQESPKVQEPTRSSTKSESNSCHE